MGQKPQLYNWIFGNQLWGLSFRLECDVVKQYIFSEFYSCDKNVTFEVMGTNETSFIFTRDQEAPFEGDDIKCFDEGLGDIPALE